MESPLYHRKANGHSQTLAHALQQAKSGELWGNPARYSTIPSVKAYTGALPDNEDGIEFTTDTRPTPGQPPRYAFWYASSEGVIVDGDMAKIKISVTRIRYNRRDIPLP
jgi:hypothetical protein